jgi:hypothetical protein
MARCHEQAGKTYELPLKHSFYSFGLLDAGEGDS